MSLIHPGYVKNTQTFNYTGGSQTWSVPDNLAKTVITVKLTGASTSQQGGYVEGTLKAAPGEDLYLYVGGSNSGTSGGWPSGGDGNTASGGFDDAASEGGAGYTAIRQSSDTFGDTVAMAAGAGGNGDAESSWSTAAGAGGQGGADTGEDGQTVTAGDADDATGGGGGSQSSGGSAGIGGGATSGGQPGGGTGGTASGSASDGDAAAAGGGGGAGWHGGGGGGAQEVTGQSGTDADAAACGGGAGANYDDGLLSVIANERGTGAPAASDGQIVVEYWVIV